MRNRSRHIAGRINEAAKSPRVFQGKIVGNSNDGTVDVEVGGSTYYNVQCVTWLITDNATGCWIMELGSGKWIVFGTNGGSTVTLDARLTVNDIVDVNEYMRTPAVSTNNGGRLILSAGESLTLAMDNIGPDDEYVYAVAENGLQVIASTDNWATGWAGMRYIALRPDQEGGQITFPNVTGTKLALYGTDYKIAISSNTLDLYTNRYFKFSNDTGNYFLFDIDSTTFQIGSGGTILSNASGSLRITSPSGYVNIGAANTSYVHFFTDRSQYFFDHKLVVDSGIISSYNEDLTLQRAGTSGLYLYSAGGCGIYNPPVTDANTGTNFYANGAAILARTRSDAYNIVTITLWQQASTDRHALLQVWEPNGDSLRVVNAEVTAFISVRASAFTVASSQRYKERIRTARDERGLLDFAVPGPRKLAFAQFRKLRPVLFDDEVQESLNVWQGCDVHETRAECSESGCPGEFNVNKEHHICDEFDCGGTNERPCWLIEQHVDRPGLVAEELYPIYPKAVVRNKDESIDGIDYAVLSVEHLNVTQHLLEDRDEMRSRLAREIMYRRSMERRLAKLEAAVRP